MNDNILHVNMPLLASKLLNQNVTPKEMVVIMSVCAEAAKSKSNMFSKTKQELGKALNVSQRIVKSAIDKMIASDVARELNRSAWMINPRISIGTNIVGDKAYSDYLESKYLEL